MMPEERSHWTDCAVNPIFEAEFTLASEAEMTALTKTLTFACVPFTVAFAVAYLLTGSLAISGALALVEPLANTVAYYLHERVWSSLRSRDADAPRSVYA